MAVAPRAKRFQARYPIVDSEGRPTPEFLRDLNSAVDIVNAIAAVQAAASQAQAAAATAQAAATDAQAAADTAQSDGGVTAAEQSLQGSYPSNYTDPLVSADSVGNIDIAAHDRVYGNSTLNPTVSVSAGSVVAPYGPGDIVRIYYDDPARAGGAVTYMATDDPSVAVQSGDRHSVGAVMIPGAGVQDGSALRPPGFVQLQ